MANPSVAHRHLGPPAPDLANSGSSHRSKVPSGVRFLLDRHQEIREIKEKLAASWRLGRSAETRSGKRRLGQLDPEPWLYRAMRGR
jgi:hypothetical protein